MPINLWTKRSRPDSPPGRHSSATPVTPGSPGNPDNWKIGKTGAVPDIVLIVASDEPKQLQDEVDHLIATLAQVPGSAASGSGLELMFDQRGNTLPGGL